MSINKTMTLYILIHVCIYVNTFQIHNNLPLHHRLLIIQIWFVRSTMPRRIYSTDYWLSKYGSYDQPCHGGFTARITGYPNIVRTINHATEDLQHGLLVIQIWFAGSTITRVILSTCDNIFGWYVSAMKNTKVVILSSLLDARQDG